jgi:hypothetical protein
MERSQEYLKREFIHYISDTIALLGGSSEIVQKIRECEEKPLTASLVDEIRKFNCLQIDNVKTRLFLCNKIEINSTD